MTPTSKPIIFFGTEDFSLTALKALIESGFTVAAVVTKQDSPKGRGHHVAPPAVKTFAIERGIPVWQPSNITDIADDISLLDRPAGVLVSFGKIIPQSMIDLFEPGIINVHPSLLPKYRGPSPIEAAILNGDEETGVSIMQLSAKMDAGPIYSQKKYELRGNESGTELLEILGEIGILELITVLPAILDRSLEPSPQDDTNASYSHLIKKSDGIIDWDKPAVQIEREIRAYKGWPQSRATILSGDCTGAEFIVTSASVSTDLPLLQPGQAKITPMKHFHIGTSEGSIVPLTVKPLGKKEMPIAAFLSGFRSST